MFTDNEQGQTHSFLDPDWISDCCGSTITQNKSTGQYPFMCNHCGKFCQPKQFHDVFISKLKKND